MNKTCIIFGSSTGTCEELASRIAGKLGVDSSDILEAASISPEQLDGYQNLILGTSTWGAGELQDDWYDGIAVIKKTNLSGKTVAIFGCGDSEGYSDTFCGAMAELYNAAKEAGANVIGSVSTEGYTFDDSDAVIDGKFIGLPLDEVNEDNKTDERIDAWVSEITPNL